VIVIAALFQENAFGHHYDTADKKLSHIVVAVGFGRRHATRRSLRIRRLRRTLDTAKQQDDELPDRSQEM
jgi:hypothetical protein